MDHFKQRQIENFAVAAFMYVQEYAARHDADKSTAPRRYGHATNIAGIIRHRQRFIAMLTEKGQGLDKVEMRSGITSLLQEHPDFFKEFKDPKVAEALLAETIAIGSGELDDIVSAQRRFNIPDRPLPDSFPAGRQNRLNRLFKGGG